ncbi:MAG: carboxypeptidase-like regulatory domain-containing protein [Bacteroidales bacterium]|nr:carboxypeptidase-like regulatory domain-containing protein [Bacteroidales bacterium]
MKKILLSIGLLLCAATLFAQTDTLRLVHSVRGKVVDAYTGRSLEAVHVAVPDRHHATVTNADGDFVIKSDAAIGTLVFTYLGYKTVYQRPREGKIEVRMVPESLQLDEALIISADPEEVVRSAVSKIPDNYSNKDELLECFYRETVQKGSRYTYIAEAVSRMFKSSYNKSTFQDRAALEKSRVLLSQRKSDTLSVKLQGGPTMATTLDVVKDNYILFNREDLQLYSYAMDTPSFIEDRLQFVVKMEPYSVDAVDYPLYHARLFVDVETLTFTRIELSLDMTDKNKATRVMLRSKPFTLRFTPREMSFIVNYRRDGERSRLGYLRCTMRFACDWRRRLFKTNYTVVNELVVTDLREPVVQISRQEMFRTGDVMTDKAKEFLDPDFWQDYNIIEPSESLEHAISRLRRQHR